MLVFVANVSCVYPLEAIVIMSFASKHAKRTSVNNQTKPNNRSLYKLCTSAIVRNVVRKTLKFNDVPNTLLCFGQTTTAPTPYQFTVMQPLICHFVGKIVFSIFVVVKSALINVFTNFSK